MTIKVVCLARKCIENFIKEDRYVERILLRGQIYSVPGILYFIIIIIIRISAQ